MTPARNLSLCPLNTQAPAPLHVPSFSQCQWVPTGKIFSGTWGTASYPTAPNLSQLFLPTWGTSPSWWVEMWPSPPLPRVRSPRGRRPREGGEEGERAAPSGRPGGRHGRSPRAPRRSPEPGFSGAGRAGDVGGRGSWLLGEPAPGEQSLPGWPPWAGCRPPSQGTPARGARVATCGAVRPARPALRLRSPGLHGWPCPVASPGAGHQPAALQVSGRPGDEDPGARPPRLAWKRLGGTRAGR